MKANAQDESFVLASKITANINGLTVLRHALEREPIKVLLKLCENVMRNDRSSAYDDYFTLISVLFKQNSRRVTGDIWQDFLFSVVIETPNGFSDECIKKMMNPPIFEAMGRDLNIMQTLFSINSEMLHHIIKSSARKKKIVSVKKPITPDREAAIKRMAISAWSAESSGRASQQENHEEWEEVIESYEEAEPDEVREDLWISFEYDTPGGQGEYVADEGLAIIYRRILASREWSDVIPHLAEFHATYGTGDFLRYNILVANDEGLSGIDRVDVLPWDSLMSVGAQKEKLYANTLRFAHTGRGENVLLYGAGGMGKTSMVLSLLDELPQLRLVFLAHKGFEGCVQTLNQLKKQPLKFIAFMDDLSLSDREYRRLKSAFAYSHGQSNSLIYATSIQKLFDESFFGVTIEFNYMSKEEFIEVVKGMSHMYNRDYKEIAQKCEDATELSMRSAQRIVLGG